MSKTLKQLIYGLFYIFILSGIISGIYFVFLKPAPSCFDNVQNQGEQGIDCGGPCSKVCIPLNLKPIEISGQPQVFHPSPSSLNVLAKIQNPNSDYAAKSFVYTFKFYDNNGNALGESQGESFIYASERKYLTVFNLSLPSVERLRRVELAIDNPEWLPANSFKNPQLNIQSKEAKESGQKVFQVDGRFTNNDTVLLPKVEVLAIFYSKFGFIGGVSKNEIDNVSPGESRTFSIIHPSIPNIDLPRTEIFLFAKRPSF